MTLCTSFITFAAIAVVRGNASPSSTALSSDRDGSQFSIHSDLSSGTHAPQQTASSDGDQGAAIVPMRLEFELEEEVTQSPGAATPTSSPSAAMIKSRHHRLVSSTTSMGPVDDEEENDPPAIEFRTPLQTLARSTSVQLEVRALPELKGHRQGTKVVCGHKDLNSIVLTETTRNNATQPRRFGIAPDTV